MRHKNIQLIVYLCRKPDFMKSREEYIKQLNQVAPVLRQDYGVRSLCMFGSVARREHHAGSDVDVCVEMEPKYSLLASLKRFLELTLGCSVDVIRRHTHMNPYLISEIERDGIYIFH